MANRQQKFAAWIKAHGNQASHMQISHSSPPSAGQQVHWGHGGRTLFHIMSRLFPYLDFHVSGAKVNPNVAKPTSRSVETRAIAAAMGK